MNIYRTATDLEGIREVTDQYKENNPMDGFFPSLWLADERNIALTDGDGNFNLFQYSKPGVYNAHTFYKTRRGKAAVQMAREVVKQCFTTYDMKVMIGYTPADNKAARWLTRQAGLKSNGIMNTPVGECELFILTKQEWESK